MCNLHLICGCRAAVAAVLLLALTLHCPDLRAELLFRGTEQINGQQHWLPVRKYSNPSDTAYAQIPADGGAAPAEEVYAFFSGPITHEDVVSAGVMASLLKSGKQKLAGNAVWLASNGGDIDAGMALGRLLRKLGVFTLIGRNDKCLSACVFVFMGGERRSVAGRLGIHRPYSPSTQDAPDRQARFRLMQKILKDYIEEMDFPYSLYEAVMLVPPESMQILAPADLKKFYLEGISPSSEDLADAASARRLDISMSEYLERKAKTPVCAFLAAGLGPCESSAQAMAAGGGAVDGPTQQAEPASTQAMGHGTDNTQDIQEPDSSQGATRSPPESS